MILQALNDYYNRLKEDSSSDIPLRGFSRQKIHFALLLNREGKLVQVTDLRENQGKKQIAKSLIVPEPVKKSVNIAPNFLWGNTGYVLGADNKEKPERAYQTFEAFKKYHHNMGMSLADDGMQAVLRFVNQWVPDDSQKLDRWEEIAGKNIVFRLDGDLCFIHERPKIREMWLNRVNETSSPVTGYCLVTGLQSPIARLHSDIKGVQPKGASLVSFNLDAFSSYNKTQNYNAPMSELVAFTYTTALNYLLRFESRQKIQIGDATTIFWTERDSPVEGFMGIIFDPRDDSGENRDVRLYLEAVRDGKYPPNIDPDISFYVLGLSPNISRLSVRFWHVSSVGDISVKIGQHFRDLSIVKSYDDDPEFPGIWFLLRETAVQRKTANIPPLLGGAVMRSILTGGPYPQSLLSSVVGRIRADQTVNYMRAAIIKACLVRKYRLLNNIQEEVTMALNKESTNIAYRLGRLFAVLERVQREAIPGANTTIRDRYYGSASATPRSVFPQLLRLAQHHIQKAQYGGKTDKLIEEIMAEIDAFPAHLKLDDQGMFSLGYYHQRQAIFTKSSDQKEVE